MTISHCFLVVNPLYITVKSTSRYDATNAIPCFPCRIVAYNSFITSRPHNIFFFFTELSANFWLSLIITNDVIFRFKFVINFKTISDIIWISHLVKCKHNCKYTNDVQVACHNQRISVHGTSKCKQLLHGLSMINHSNQACSVKVSPTELATGDEVA